MTSISTDQPESLRYSRDFRLLSIGGGISALGDQFTLVALPLLVLALSNDPWVLGLVLALLGIPRSILLLFGGALIDRFSPKLISLINKYINASILFLISGLLYQGSLTVTLLCIFAFILGTSSGFSAPTGNSMLPRLVLPHQLAKANSIFVMIGQMALLIGPFLAGLILAYKTDIPAAMKESLTTDEYQLALLFFCDALSFLVSAVLLSLVNFRKIDKKEDNDNIWMNIKQGISYFWQRPAFRNLVFYIGFLSGLIGGLIQLSIPLLIKQEFSSSDDTYAFFIGFQGLGAIMGVLLLGGKIHARKWHLGKMYLKKNCIIAILIGSLGFIDNIIYGYIIAFSISFLASTFQIALTTWIQQNVAPEMMGRVMSIMMFSIIGVGPIFAMAAGILLSSNLVTVNVLLVISGVSLLITSLLSLHVNLLKDVN